MGSFVFVGDNYKFGFLPVEGIVQSWLGITIIFGDLSTNSRQISTNYPRISTNLMNSPVLVGDIYNFLLDIYKF
jgi:hypothetical protein